MNNVHFAIPEIYGETLSYYELLRNLVNKVNDLIDNYNTVPDQIAEEVKNLDASQLFSTVLNQLIHSIATDNTKSANAVKVYKKHDLLYATFNETVNLYESLIDFSTGTATELIVGTNIREVNISELFIELRKLIDINKNNIAAVTAVANENSADITTIHVDITAIENKNSEQDNEISTLRTMISSPYNFKGDVASISALPASGEVNDTYYVQDVKYKVTWTGSAWVQSSLSEADYQTELSELKGDLSNFNEENRNKFSMISKNLEREVDYEIIGTPNRLWSVDSNNNITELEGLYNYYASIDVIDISDAVSFDVSTQLAKNPYTSDGRISCPSILITDEDGKVLTSIMSNGEIQTLSDSVLINKYKYLYVNYNKVNESSVSIKKTIITSAVSQDYADSNNERVSLIEEDIRNEINKGIHPLILDMSADYWNTSIYSVKNNENDAYFSITANEGDEFVSITSSHNIDISSIGNDIKNAGNMCIVYDDGTVKPVNVWRKTDTQINVFPMVEKDITNGFLYTFQLNDIHLTEKGYIGYAQTVYNANPKYLDKSESLYRYRPRLSIENGNKKCYPFVSFGIVTDMNYSAQQTGQSFYSGQEYTIGYSESNVDNEIDSGFSWEVDLHKETGYVEAYVGLSGSRSSFSFTYSDQGAVMIDLYLDDVLVKRIEKTKAGLERICIDFANAKKGKIVIHKNKWTKYGHGFNIGNVTWYKSHPDYNKSALPKFSIPVVLFDSWSNMSFPAFGSALKNIINSDCGFNAPFYDESLGGSTIAWARQWFYDKVISDSADGLADEYDESKNYKLGERCVYKGNLYENFGASPGQFDKTGWGLICRKKKYKPTHVFIDHVLNDKGTSSGDTRYSTDSPTGEQYQFSTTKEEYLKWMKDVIDMAINNGIQPIICGNNKRYCESWYLALVDYLDTADDSNIYWSHD